MPARGNPRSRNPTTTLFWLAIVAGRRRPSARHAWSDSIPTGSRTGPFPHVSTLAQRSEKEEAEANARVKAARQAPGRSSTC